MAKLPFTKSEQQVSGLVAVPFTELRKISKDKFEVITGTVMGTPTDLKVIEKNVSLFVGRDSAARAIRRQVEKQLNTLGSTLD